MMANNSAITMIIMSADALQQDEDNATADATTTTYGGTDSISSLYTTLVTTPFFESSSLTGGIETTSTAPTEEVTDEDPTVVEWILYTAIAIMLIVTIVQALAKFFLNTWVFVEILVGGTGVSKKVIAFVLLLLYGPYTCFVWYLICSSIDWPSLARADFPSAFRDTGLSGSQLIYLYPEVVFMTLLSFVEILNAVYAWVRAPAKDEIMQLFTSSSSSSSSSQYEHQHQHPMVNVVMPIYNEPLPSLMEAINSVAHTRYPLHRVELMLAFDEKKQTDLYMSTVYCLTKHAESLHGSVTKSMYANVEANIRHLIETEMSDMQTVPQIHFLTYRGLQVTVCRFRHGGKRNAQKWAHIALQEKWRDAPEKPLLLFIDSDIVLDPYAVHMLSSRFITNAADQDAKKGKSSRPWGTTGLILCKPAGNRCDFMTAFQDAEYIKGQAFQRQLEDTFGFVTCLPGALTMMTYESLDSVAKKYFIRNTGSGSKAYKFARIHLGEDRYLTHLFMANSHQWGATRYQSAAKCETEAVGSLRPLLKQRRRWVLGGITNNAEMFTDVRLWTGYTVILLVSCLRQFLGIRPVVLFYIQIVKIAMGDDPAGAWYWYLPGVIILAGSYLFLAANAVFSLKHKGIVVFYPVLILLLPIFDIMVDIYTCLTLRQQTWGGPRVSKEEEEAETKSFRESVRHSISSRKGSNFS